MLGNLIELCNIPRIQVFHWLKEWNLRVAEVLTLTLVTLEMEVIWKTGVLKPSRTKMKNVANIISVNDI